MSTPVLFLSLLAYSLLPGVAKILDRSFLFAGNLLVIAVLLYRAPPLRWTTKDKPVLLFLAWTALYLPIAYLIVPGADGGLLLLGAYLFLVPTAGYAIARAYPLPQVTTALAGVGLCHVVIGVLTYGLLPLPDWAARVREGTMVFRMSSVSGSLAFSGLAVVTFVFLLGLWAEEARGARKILWGLLAILAFAGVILSLQRAAWLAAAAAVVSLAMTGGNRARRAAARIGAVAVLVAVAAWPLMETLVDVSLMQQRVESLVDTRSEEGAVGERSGMWRASLGHVASVPTGLGLGQVGQATRVLDRETEYAVVVDGDYFKIAAECGIPGVVFLVYLLARVAVSFRAGARSTSAGIARSALLALLIQMVGSNVSELYFTNFVLWMLCGYVVKDSVERGEQAEGTPECLPGAASSTPRPAGC